MRIDVFTIFPEYFDGPADGVAARAGPGSAGLLDVRVHDPRDWHDRPPPQPSTTRPFGGGAGMVMMPEPLFAAVEAVDAAPARCSCSRPRGRRFDQAVAARAGRADGFSLLCGRYEGVDQRVADHLCDGELSVGDFVLAGGEAAALVVDRGGGPARARRDGQRGVGGRGVVRRRPARVPAVHPAGRVPGLGGARGRCARATTPGSPAGAGPQALRRTLERRPDLLAAAAG